MTVAALLAGRQGLAAIARRGRGCSRQQLARLGIDRPKSPCHATYHNVFKALDSAAMERALGEWVKEALPAGVAIDGKTLRGGRHADYPAVHLLAAYCEAVTGVLAQMPVETSKERESVEVVCGIRWSHRFWPACATRWCDSCALLARIPWWRLSNISPNTGMTP